MSTDINDLHASNDLKHGYFPLSVQNIGYSVNKKIWITTVDVYILH